MDIDEREEKTSVAKKVKENKTTASAEIDLPKPQASKAEDFEIVPAPDTDSSDDSSVDEPDDSDIETKAEVLAYAKKMLRKKQREQILDDAYNKYMFDDEGLPKWFLDEEKKHR